MQPLIWLRDYLWVAPAVFQTGIVVLMVKRKLHKEFPLFLAYNVECILGVAVLLAMYLSPQVSGRAWGAAYFVDTGLNAVLRFAVIYEIFSKVFFGHSVLTRLGKPIFRGSLLLLLALAIVIAIFTKGHESDFGMYALHLLEQTVSILQVGLLMVLFSISAYIGLSWRNHVFGMALGLGIFACVKLGTAAFQAYRVSSGSIHVNLIVLGSFHAVVLLWLYYIYAGERSPAKSVMAIPAHNLDLWNEELQRLLQQ